MRAGHGGPRSGLASEGVWKGIGGVGSWSVGGDSLCRSSKLGLGVRGEIGLDVRHRLRRTLRLEHGSPAAGLTGFAARVGGGPYAEGGGRRLEGQGEAVPVGGVQRAILGGGHGKQVAVQVHDADLFGVECAATTNVVTSAASTDGAPGPLFQWARDGREGRGGRRSDGCDVRLDMCWRKAKPVVECVEESNGGDADYDLAIGTGGIGGSDAPRGMNDGEGGVVVVGITPRAVVSMERGGARAMGVVAWSVASRHLHVQVSDQVSGQVASEAASVEGGMDVLGRKLYEGGVVCARRGLPVVGDDGTDASDGVPADARRKLVIANAAGGVRQVIMECVERAP